MDDELNAITPAGDSGPVLAYDDAWPWCVSWRAACSSLSPAGSGARQASSRRRRLASPWLLLLAISIRKVV